MCVCALSAGKSLEKKKRKEERKKEGKGKKEIRKERDKERRKEIFKIGIKGDQTIVYNDQLIEENNYETNKYKM